MISSEIIGFMFVLSGPDGPDDSPGR